MREQMKSLPKVRYLIIVISMADEVVGKNFIIITRICYLRGYEPSNKSLFYNVLYIMSAVCFKEFKGWCKSFTKTEVYLSLLEVIFLVFLIAFITFLILHFIACWRLKHEFNTEVTPRNHTDNTKMPPTEISSVVHTIEPTEPSTRSTLEMGIECTWTPSKKTEAFAQYYEGGQVVTVPSSSNTKDKLSSSQIFKSKTTERLLDISSDVDIVGDVRKNFLLALVKVRHPRDVLFGCTLTVVSNHWTISAASCIEAIEEVDALDSFLIMEKFGEEAQGQTHELSDIIIHPEYRGINKSYDLVAIKSDDVLVKDGIPTITLPTLVDNSLITLGERLGVFGFGKFSTEADLLDRRVREVSVYKLVRSQCPGADTWAARHMTGGHAVERGVGGAFQGICAGRAGAGAEAGATCPCGGAPLLRARTLLGVMSDDGSCGLSCRPALYVDLALRMDWLDSVLKDN